MGRSHLGRMLRALACIAALGGCEGVWDGSGSGVVAISAPDTGAVVLINVATGARRELVSEDGPYGAITLSPNGRNVAFARSGEVLERALFVADTRLGWSRTIAPTTGSFTPQPVWLNSDWFWSPITVGDSLQTALVGPGQTDARLMGTNWFVTLRPSPVDDLIAYADCYEQGVFVNHFCLVLERLDGSDRMTLASDISSPSPQFSPDGSLLVYLAETAGETRLWAHPVAGGAPVDLGPAESPWPHDDDALPGSSWFSPDGAEVLLQRDGQLLAAALDGSGARLIADAPVRRAAFTAAGDVVYEVVVDANPVPSDTPAYVHSSFVAQVGGAVVPLQSGPECDVLMISDSGAYVGYRCGNGAIHRTSDGTQVVDTGGFYLLGFDRAEEGMVVADFEQVSYVPLDGSAPRELAAYFEGQDAPFYPFDYAP